MLCWEAGTVLCLQVQSRARVVVPQSLHFCGYMLNPAQPHLVSEVLSSRTFALKKYPKADFARG